MSNSGPVLSVYLVYIKRVRFGPMTDQFYPKVDKSETFSDTISVHVLKCTLKMYRTCPILAQYVPRDVWYGSKLGAIGSKWDKSETFTSFSAFWLGDLKYYWKIHHKQSEMCPIWGKSVCLSISSIGLPDLGPKRASFYPK